MLCLMHFFVTSPSTGSNFGKLNYYLGARAAEEGRASRYPDVNFCEHPDAICASEEHKELKWIAGMFYWVESLQNYNVGGWDYISELKKFVDNGMSGNSFIDAVSGIVNRGCHNPPFRFTIQKQDMGRDKNWQRVQMRLTIPYGPKLSFSAMSITCMWSSSSSSGTETIIVERPTLMVRKPEPNLESFLTDPRRVTKDERLQQTANCGK
eukprot:CCRYP_004976-RM/>CCRYP_004976-RM protein AED:0.47 eAED:0.49 QI:0/0/0/1/0/0/4/0/208